MLNTQRGTLIENARAGAVAFIDFSLGDVVVEAGAAGFTWPSRASSPPVERSKGLTPSLGFRHVFLSRLSSRLIKQKQQTPWGSGQIKGGVYLWVKNFHILIFLPTALPATGGKPGLFYVKLNPFVFI